MTDKPRVIPESKIAISPVIIDDSYRTKYPEGGMGELIELFHSWDNKKCFSIYRQDAGMGEYDYCVLMNNEFLFRAEHHKVARNIVMAIRNALELEELKI